MFSVVGKILTRKVGNGSGICNRNIGDPRGSETNRRRIDDESARRAAGSGAGAARNKGVHSPRSLKPERMAPVAAIGNRQSAIRRADFAPRYPRRPATLADERLFDDVVSRLVVAAFCEAQAVEQFARVAQHMRAAAE